MFLLVLILFFVFTITIIKIIYFINLLLIYNTYYERGAGAKQILLTKILSKIHSLTIAV